VGAGFVIYVWGDADGTIDNVVLIER
jgi:hypothetical protein